MYFGLFHSSSKKLRVTESNLKVVVTVSVPKERRRQIK